MSIRVLFEDDDMIAVDKPPGLATHATLDPKRDHLSAQVREHLYAHRRAHLAGRGDASKVYLGEHHRLDRDTSGVIVFAKTERANPGLSRAFKEHLATKSYLALTGAFTRADARWQTRNFLADDGKSGRVRAVRSGGKTAITDFELLAHSVTACLVLARPLTGRRHQIRAHLAEHARAILGDPTYFDPTVDPGPLAPAAPRLMLHAWKLALPHPISGDPLEIRAPLPADFIAVARARGLELGSVCES